MKNSLKKIMMQFNDCQLDHRWSLTRPFHHDRGRIVFAVSPRRGEQGALGPHSVGIEQQNKNGRWPWKNKIAALFKVQDKSESNR